MLDHGFNIAYSRFWGNYSSNLKIHNNIQIIHILVPWNLVENGKTDKKKLSF
jgi:hypothetical protein